MHSVHTGCAGGVVALIQLGVYGLDDDVASSTTIAIASTSAESVRRFSEKPKICRKKNVPTSDTGTAMAGMSVLRKSCRKIYTTMKTRRKASRSVWMTCQIEA